MERQHIEKIIWEIINENHELGDQVGGSGHKATIYANLLDLSTEESEDDVLKVTFQYSIIRESEFTVYSEDADPEDIYEQTITIKNQHMTSKEQLVQIKSAFNPENFEIHGFDDDHWFDRLDAAYKKGYTELEQRDAIRYFHSKDDFPAKLLTPSKSFNLKYFPKSMWENHLKVLKKWIDREDVKLFFCRLIDDPNWPGYGFAWNTLKDTISTSIPVIEKQIAASSNDPDQVTLLKELKEETILYEQSITQLIIDEIKDIYSNQYPEFRKTEITIIRISPRYERGYFVYEAKFLVKNSYFKKDKSSTEMWPFIIDNNRASLHQNK